MIIHENIILLMTFNIKIILFPLLLPDLWAFKIVSHNLNEFGCLIQDCKRGRRNDCRSMKFCVYAYLVQSSTMSRSDIINIASMAIQYPPSGKDESWNIPNPRTSIIIIFALNLLSIHNGIMYKMWEAFSTSSLRYWHF